MPLAPAHQPSHSAAGLQNTPADGTHRWPSPLYLPQLILWEQVGTNGADVSGEGGILKKQSLAQTQGSQVVEVLVIKFLQVLEASRCPCCLPALLQRQSRARGEHGALFL